LLERTEKSVKIVEGVDQNVEQMRERKMIGLSRRLSLCRVAATWRSSRSLAPASVEERVVFADLGSTLRRNGAEKPLAQMMLLQDDAVWRAKHPTSQQGQL
jgi:hypothetical protein